MVGQVILVVLLGVLSLLVVGVTLFLIGGLVILIVQMFRPLPSPPAVERSLPLPSPSVELLVRQGLLLQAIKQYRSEHQATLDEAKRAIRMIQATYTRQAL